MFLGVCEKVAEVVTPFLEKEGLRLWDVEFKKEGAEYFLRVYIDRDGGVGIDDCVKVDGFLSPILDELDPIQQSYCFEVSSAGLVRELKRDEHFDRFIGKRVTVHTYKSLDGILPKKFDATLVGHDEGNIILKIKDETRNVGRSLISKISIDLV